MKVKKLDFIQEEIRELYSWINNAHSEITKYRYKQKLKEKLSEFVEAKKKIKVCNNCNESLTNNRIHKILKYSCPNISVFHEIGLCDCGNQTILSFYRDGNCKLCGKCQMKRIS